MNRQCRAILRGRCCVLRGQLLHSGHGLVEVLVALAVLAIGALGASATLLAARRAAHHAMLMSEAVQLATRAGEAMRANGGFHGVADAANPYLQLDYDAVADGPPAAPTDCSNDPCDQAALAEADLAGLRRALFDHYPPARIKICRDGAPWDGAAMRWDCDGAAAAPVFVKIGWRERLDAHAGRASPASGVPLLLAIPVADASTGTAP